ncbi:MAG TPA: expansin EXLX1 family cellulose-binding protein [Polyangiaceae bacterium]
MRTHSWLKHGRRLLCVAPLLWFIACSSGGVTGVPSASAGSSGSGMSTSGAPTTAGVGGALVSNGGAPIVSMGAGAGGVSGAAGGSLAGAGGSAAGAGGSAAGAIGGGGGAANSCVGVTCGTGQTCSNGTCMCMSGSLCSDGCFDTQSDQNHCGSCTTKCAADGACVSGKCVNPTCNPDTQQRSGHITTYSLATSLVACHYPTNTLPQYYGAMNEYDWNGSGVCGACVEITNTQNQKKLTVQITDECPYKGNEQWCFQGSHHIDLNGAAYGALGANNNPATTWKYVACSTTGNLKYYFDTASQQYYLAVTPMNAQNLVAKMEVMTKDGYQALTHTAYNTYELKTGAGTGALTFRLTDIYNHVVTEAVNLSAGQVVQGNKQFAACP